MYLSWRGLTLERTLRFLAVASIFAVISAGFVPGAGGGPPGDPEVLVPPGVGWVEPSHSDAEQRFTELFSLDGARLVVAVRDVDGTNSLRSVSLDSGSSVRLDAPACAGTTRSARYG